MSLQVWLPLNGDLRNLGCSNASLTNTNAAVNNSGKIGSCYSFGTSNSYLKFNDINFMHSFTECSVSLWLKILSWNTSYATYFQFGLGSTPWAHYIFGLLRNSSASTLCFTISNGSSATNANCLTPALELNTWYHLTLTYANGHCKIYVNGVETKDYSTTIVPNFSGITTGTIGAANNLTGYQTNCLINDFRVYDHCLSAAEVHEIAQGLILHYKLDNTPQGEIINAYNMSSWDTSTTRGGFSAWGPSGHAGTSGNNTDRQYIYRQDRTYSYYISENAGTGKYFIFYQSPAFSGGYRSLSAIIKEENSLPINETICTPGWNANVAGTGHAPINIWTRKISLGNGFYLCQVDGFYQDGSNDLVSIAVLPGYKIYISEIWLENDKQVCSDVLFPIEYIEDSSGYNHNGTITGNITLNSNTPRYSASSLFNGTERITTTTPGADIRTLSCWCKTTKNKSTSQQMVADSFSNMTISFYNGTIIGVFGTTRSTGSKCTLGDSYKENDWNHIVVVKTDDAGARDIYCNGVKLTPTSNDYWGAATGFFVGARNTSNGNPFYGQISDVRAYCTALSADDILQLYHTSAKVDNKQNFHTFELEETGGPELLAVPLTTSYGNRTNIYTAYNDDGEITLTGGSSIGSGYIPISPTGKVYYFDIDVSIDAGNQFYIGFERFDIDKAATSNSSCDYVVAVKPSSALIHQHYFGTRTWTANLSTGKPPAYIALRILNDWSGANGRKATIHSISLREVTTLTNEQILKAGITKADEFIEGEKTAIQQNKIIRSKNFIEL